MRANFVRLAVLAAWCAVLVAAAASAATPRQDAAPGSREQVTRRAAVYLRPPARPPIHGMTYASRPDGPLKLDVTYPPRLLASTPAVMVLHGGGWWTGRKEDMRGMRGLPAALANAGFVAISIDYRLACRPPSDEDVPDAAGTSRRPCRWLVGDQVQDVREALRFVRTRAGLLGVDPGRVGMLGVSAGGHLALLTALGSPEGARVRAVVNWSGPPSLDYLHEPDAPTPSAADRIFSVQPALQNAIGCPAAECPGAWRAADPSHALKQLGRRPPAIMSVGGEQETAVPLDVLRAFHLRLAALGAPSAVDAGPEDCHGLSCANYQLAGSDRTALTSSVAFLREQLAVASPPGARR